jgi:hypothetical protein
MPPRLTLSLVTLLSIACATRAARAQSPGISVYAPYAFLIGEWDVGPEGGPPMGVMRLRWGPNQSYIWYSMSLLDGGKEEPHFEGLLMWNGVHRNLDMLIALDLSGGRGQEQGVVRVEDDGTVVRDITAYYSQGAGAPSTGAIAGPAGATARFRQTYRAEGPGRVVTTVMRETANGWIATFPGSDHLVMTRRPA